MTNPLRLQFQWCLLALLAMCNQATDAPGAPQDKLEFSPSAPSFGVIENAPLTNMTLDVTVTNRGDVAFDLRQVQIGCGCMDAEVVSPGNINSGESGKIRVTLKRSSIRLGPSQYPLTVLEGSNPVASVPVTYTYEPTVYAEQADLFIDSDGGPAEKGTQTVVHVNRPRAGAAPPEVKCDSDLFSVKLSPVAPSSPGQYQLSVTCAKNAPPIGNVTATVTVRLAGSSTPDLTIPLHCSIRPPVSTYPAAVLLKTLRAGHTIRRTLRLESHEPFTVESVGSSSAEIEVRQQDPQETDVRDDDGRITRAYELVISPTSKPGATFDAEVRFTIGGRAAFELVVPVIGEVTGD